MKKHIVLCMLSVFLLTACSNADETIPTNTESEATTMSIETTVSTTEEVTSAATEEVIVEAAPEIEYEVEVSELIIQNDEAHKRIYGKLYTPKGEGNFPTVILSHGYNGGHPNYEKECAFFASKGYIAYAFDFCGGSSWSRSSGRSTGMTVFTEKEDLLIVFDYITAMEHVDTKNVFLLGGSQGGLITTLAVEERADAVKGLILYFPALNIPDDWRGKYPAPEAAPETFDFWDVKLGKEFVTSIHDFYPFEVIRNFKGDVIIFEGTEDYIVPMAAAEKTAALYDNSELIVFEGEGHGFSEETNKICMERALEFMRK